jgi:hypothetical protein
LIRRPLAGLTFFFGSFLTNILASSILALYPLVVTHTSITGWSLSIVATCTRTFNLDFFSSSLVTFFHRG